MFLLIIQVVFESIKLNKSYQINYHINISFYIEKNHSIPKDKNRLVLASIISTVLTSTMAINNLIQGILIMTWTLVRRLLIKVLLIISLELSEKLTTGI